MKFSNMKCSMLIWNMSLMKEQVIFQLLQNKKEFALSRCRGKRRLNETEQRALVSSDLRYSI